MDSVRAWTLVAKYLDAPDLLNTSSVCRFLSRVTSSDEVWQELVDTRSEGLISPTRSHYPTPKAMYRALYTSHAVPCIIHQVYTRYPVSSPNSPFKVTLPTSTELTKGSYLMFLPDSSLFACGGDRNSESFYDYGLKVVYRVYSLPLSVERLPDLPSPRRYPCGVYYRGRVYLFGGADNREMLNTAVKYDLFQTKWEGLGNMLEQRCSTTPCLYASSIYLVGGFPATGAEVYSILKDTYTLLPIQLNGSADCVSVIFNSDLVLFTLKKVRIYRLPDCSELLHTQEINSDNYVWSHAQPLICQNQVWFYYWHRQCLGHFDYSDKVFSLQKAWSYAEMATRT